MRRDLLTGAIFLLPSPIIFGILKQLEFARPTSCVVVNTSAVYHSVMTEAIDRMIINNEDPEQVLTEAAADLQQEIDRRRDEGELIDVP